MPTRSWSRAIAGPALALALCAQAAPRHPAQESAPAPAPSTGKSYLKHGRRKAMELATVGVAVTLSLHEGRVSHARIVLGAVAPTAMLVEAAGKALVGSKLDNAALEKAAEACRAACRPIDDKRGTVEFRTEVAGVLARRAADADRYRRHGDGNGGR